MTEKEYHKEITAIQKQIHDPESLNQLYHTARRLLQNQPDSYEPCNSVGSFLWDRLLGDGRW